VYIYGNTVMHTRRGRNNSCLYCKFPTECIHETTLTIGQYLATLWGKLRCLLFYDSRWVPLFVFFTALYNKKIDSYWYV